MEKSQRINIRVTEAEKEAWTKASGGDISRWLREIANAYTQSSFPGASVVAPPSSRKTSQAKTQCSRWMHHRPGVFCGSCNA